MNDFPINGRKETTPFQAEDIIRDYGKAIKPISIYSYSNNLIIEVDFLRIATYSAGSEYVEHCHNNYEIHLIINGTGQAIIDDCYYEISKDSFFIIPPQVMHRHIISESGLMKQYILQCTIPGKNKKDDQKGNPELQVFQKKPYKIIKAGPQIKEIFEEIIEEGDKKRIGYYPLLCSKTIELIILFQREFFNGKTEIEDEYSDKYPQKNFDKKRVELVQKYINKNINMPITNKAIADHLCLSEKQLNRIIKKITGDTLHNFIVKQKMILSLRYIREGKLTLKEIADIVGFNNEYYLSKLIKNKTKFSPSEHRKKIIMVDEFYL